MTSTMSSRAAPSCALEHGTLFPRFAWILISVLTVSVWGLGPVMAAAAVAFVLALLYFVPRPAAAMALFVCFIPHLGEPEVSRVLPRLWVAPFVLLAASAVAAVLARPRQVRVDPLLLCLTVLFVLAGVVSLTVGLEPFLQPFGAAVGLWRRPREILMASSLLLFAMCACRARRDFERVLWAVVLSGIPYAFTVFLFGAEVEAGGEVFRRQGFYASGHAAALHMLFCAIVTTSLLRVSRKRGRKLLLWGCLLLFLATQFAANIRTVQATIPVLFLCGIAMEFRLRGILIGGLMLAAGLALVFPLLPDVMQSNILTILAAATGRVSPEIQHYAQGGARLSTFLGRIDHVRQGIDLASRYPLFGVGVGRHTWTIVIAAGPQLHNYYIVLLAELGLFGLGIFMLTVSYGLLTGIRLLRHARRCADEWTFFVAQGFVLSMVAVLMMFLATPGHATGERYIWVLIGLIAALSMRFGESAGAETSAAEHTPTPGEEPRQGVR